MNAIFHTQATHKATGKYRESFQKHLEDAVFEYFEAAMRQNIMDKVEGGHLQPELIQMRFASIQLEKDKPPKRHLTLEFTHPCINATIDLIPTKPIQ